MKTANERPTGGWARSWQALFDLGPTSHRDDGELLDHYRRGRGATDAAFEAIVRRHGPNVLAICRREGLDSHAADDAFQAVFLVLARRADAIRDGQRLGAWLGRVARRVARRARARAARDQRREGADLPVAVAEPAAAEFGVEEIREVVRDEVARLPGPLRAAVMLCDLQGLSRPEAARRLGWPIGTLHSRLSRARGRLRMRLERRDLASPAIVAPTLIARTIRLARPGGTVPATVAALADATTLGLAIGPIVAVGGLGVMALVLAAGHGTRFVRPGPESPKHPTTVAMVPAAVAVPAPVNDEPDDTHVHGAIWHLGFEAAQAEARREHRPILAFFNTSREAEAQAFESTHLTDPKVKTQLARFARAELFLDEIPIRVGMTEEQRLERVAANRGLLGRWMEPHRVGFGPRLAVADAEGRILADRDLKELSPEACAEFLRTAVPAADRPVVRWRSPMPGIPGEPAVVDGVAYVVVVPREAAKRTAEIRAIAMRDGSTLWSFSAETDSGGNIFGQAPAIAGDRVITTFSRAVVALDRRTGELLWKSELPIVADKLPPQVVGDRVLVGTWGGEVRAYRLSDGRPLWARRFDESLAEGPEPGVTVIPWPAGTSVVGIDAVTGRKLWDTDLGNRIVTMPTVADDAVYAAANGVARLDRATGRVLWRTDQGWSRSGIAATADAVFATNCDRRVVRLNPMTGSVVWGFDTMPDDFAPNSPGSPKIVGDDLVFASGSGFAYRLAQKDGALRWKLRIDRKAEVMAPTAVDGEDVLVSHLTVQSGDKPDAVVRIGPAD